MTDKESLQFKPIMDWIESHDKGQITLNIGVKELKKVIKVEYREFGDEISIEL